jgi:hypothetical protein
MKKLFLLSIAAIGLILIGTGDLAARSNSVDGEWDAVYDTPGGTRPVKLVFKTDGEKLTGTAKRPSSDVPVSGTLKGDAITFSYTIVYGGNELTLTFNGKVTGDKMAGTVIIGSTEDNWSATRAGK